MSGDAIENQWKDSLKIKFPQYFKNCRICEIGSADINGTSNSWFENCEYIGIDIAPYKNVNVVSIAHEYNAPSESFDVLYSTSELEHDMHWDKTLRKMVDLLKPKGFMWFVAGHDMGEHGTRNNNPNDSLTVGSYDEKWPDYYGNISKEMVRSVLDLDKIFKEYEIKYVDEHGQKDLFIYFWGIKR